MTDPRVEALAAARIERHGDGHSPTLIGVHQRRSAETIAELEAAGLLVLADNDATVERIASAIYPELMMRDGNYEPAKWANADGPHREAWLEAASAAVSALRSSPPADFPAAGGEPEDGAE